MNIFDLQLFTFTPGTDAGTESITPVNLTTTATLSPAMRKFYDKTLLENSRPAEIFSQFGKKVSSKGAKTISWRRMRKLDKKLSALSEGVIPSGQTLGMSEITATVAQYGDYVAVSDRLQFETEDPIIYETTKDIAGVSGEVSDICKRNVLIAGTNVMYAPKVSGGSETTVSARADLDATAKLTVKLVSKGTAFLKRWGAPKNGTDYICVIHPDVGFDLKNDPKWEAWHVYTTPENKYNGEIGRIEGVRFIENTNAKVWRGGVLAGGSYTLTVKTAIAASTTTVAVKEAISADEATALAGKTIWAGGVANTIVSATSGVAGSASLTVGTAITTLAADSIICEKGGTKNGLGVYGCLLFGADAYGTVDPEGEGRQVIVKDKGTIGGPLEQFSTIGYKQSEATAILYQERMIRIEVSGELADTVEGN